MATTKELNGLTYSIAKQMRIAGLLSSVERLELVEPTKKGGPWQVNVIRPNGARYLAGFDSSSGGVGTNKAHVKVALEAVLRTLLMVNNR